MHPNLRLCAALIAVVTVASACGSDADSESSTPSVDLSQLETGSYQSTPRDPNMSKADATGQAIEAVRLGAAVPLPYDVDRSYAFQRLNSPRLRSTSKLPGSMTKIDPAEFHEVTDGLIAGWKSSGERREQPFLGRQAWIHVYRFETEAQAAIAAERIPAKQQKLGTGQRVEIPGYPAARNNWAGSVLDSWMAKGPMVFGVRIDDPMTEPPDPAAAIDFTQKAYAKIIEMQAGYSPTPVDKIAALPIDTDGMLSRTLPGEEDHRIDPLVPEGAVEPTQAALARDEFPGTTKPALVDAGVDLISSESTLARVYRAENTKAAQRLMAALIEPYSRFMKPIDSPRNLPDAKCFDRKDSSASSSGLTPICYVVYDRFLARVTASSVQDLHHRTAAQYKLLAVDR
ncbi:hypothetical protein [Nocardia sp. NPDC058705]|uniref:DUF7373 family lipoprotein n=1 Tax=Nocardia sp. NPDC058705 TaxID=3346609 RepID=UPI00368FFB41